MERLLQDLWSNFSHNLFKPLLLFFYLGFLIPLCRIKFEFPRALYQGITIYLLVAIGWHGGEELAKVGGSVLAQAAGFIVVGFVTNFLIGILAYRILRAFTPLRQVDAATVAGYYGSDSAGTFVTTLGVLGTAKILYAPYMPVMLAVMEIPGCLVALYLVAQLRHKGMDANGNMPGEEIYPGTTTGSAEGQEAQQEGQMEEATVGVGARKGYTLETAEGGAQTGIQTPSPANRGRSGHGLPEAENGHGDHHGGGRPTEPNGAKGFLSGKVLHEVFLNPGLYLLFGGIFIGFLSQLQGDEVVKKEDPLFLALFEGILCLFLLEMGITACMRLRDLKRAGWRFIAFGLIAPNVFATLGITVAHLYAHAIGARLEVGTYVLFAVLCGAASYIAVPAVQRLAIPEASPTLPLAASLGLTFSYNVTIGIPVYIEISKAVMAAWPVG